jgi:hypothetical protein
MGIANAGSVLTRPICVLEALAEELNAQRFFEQVQFGRGR